MKQPHFSKRKIVEAADHADLVLQVAELHDAVEAAKDRSLAEVIGRRRLELGQLQEADMAVAASEHRILDILLATHDIADRRDLLRDAFTPPSDTDFQVCQLPDDCHDGPRNLLLDL